MSPVLYIGVTLASLKIDGKMALERLRLMSSDKEVEMTGAATRRALPLIPSRPTALCSPRMDSCLKTQSGLVGGIVSLVMDGEGNPDCERLMGWQIEEKC